MWMLGSSHNNQAFILVRVWTQTDKDIAKVSRSVLIEIHHDILQEAI